MTCSIDRNTEAIGGPVNTVILISVAQELVISFRIVKLIKSKEVV
jgi:hypothetical protein